MKKIVLDSFFALCVLCIIFSCKEKFVDKVEDLLSEVNCSKEESLIQVSESHIPFFESESLFYRYANPSIGPIPPENSSIIVEDNPFEIFSKLDKDFGKIVVSSNKNGNRAIISILADGKLREFYNRNNALGVIYKIGTQSVSKTVLYCRAFNIFFVSTKDGYYPQRAFYFENNVYNEISSPLIDFISSRGSKVLINKDDPIKDADHSFIEKSLNKHSDKCPCRNLYLIEKGAEKMSLLHYDECSKVHFMLEKRMYLYWESREQRLLGMEFSPKNINNSINVINNSIKKSYDMCYFNGNKFEIISKKENVEKKIGDYLIVGYKIPELYEAKHEFEICHDAIEGPIPEILKLKNPCLNSDLSKGIGLFYKHDESYFKLTPYAISRLCASINQHDKQGVGYCNQFNNFYSKSSNKVVPIYIKEDSQGMKPFVAGDSLTGIREILNKSFAFFDRNVIHHDIDCVCKSVFIEFGDSRYKISSRAGRTDLSFQIFIGNTRVTYFLCWDGLNNKLIGICKGNDLIGVNEVNNFELIDIGLIYFTSEGFVQIDNSKELIENILNIRVKFEFPLKELKEIISEKFSIINPIYEEGLDDIIEDIAISKEEVLYNSSELDLSIGSVSKKSKLAMKKSKKEEKRGVLRNNIIKEILEEDDASYVMGASKKIRL